MSAKQQEVVGVSTKQQEMVGMSAKQKEVVGVSAEQKCLNSSQKGQQRQRQWLPYGSLSVCQLAPKQVQRRGRQLCSGLLATNTGTMTQAAHQCACQGFLCRGLEPSSQLFFEQTHLPCLP